MALEKDLELIDDYLSNRMDIKDKTAFEERLGNDQALSEEFKLQQSLVEGIRQARILELKSMLNSIPVTSVPPSQTALLTKIGGWALVTGLVATATYFYFSGNDSNTTKEVPTEQATPEPTRVPDAEPAESIPQTPAEEESVQPVEKPSAKSIEPAVKPAIHAYDPTAEDSDVSQKFEQEQLSLINDAFVTSSMEVETHSGDKKYNFHYVFSDDKLVLYGSFEKHLYEILEFINESENKKTVALYYKTNYYLLDVTKSTPTLLTPIKNKELLKKLQEHRGK